MLLCQDRRSYHDIKSSTKAIIFLGTPHTGTDHASVLATTQKFITFVTRSQPSNITKELETFSDTVIDINESFMGETSKSIELVGFWESVPTKLPSASKLIKSEPVIETCPRNIC